MWVGGVSLVSFTHSFYFVSFIVKMYHFFYMLFSTLRHRSNKQNLIIAVMTIKKGSTQIVVIMQPSSAIVIFPLFYEKAC